MSNFQVYKKTLPFSLFSFLFDLLGFLVVVGLATAGFFIFANGGDAGMGILGLILGLILGGVLAFLINLFITNRIKSAQIAMMTKGVSEDNLPDHTFKAGMQEMKGKFGKITAFLFITNAIKGIFRQVGKAINALGTAVGGNTGNVVTSTINTGVEILIGYLCDCCLGWIFYRKDINSFKAGCEGAVIFFKHGKTLLRNIGRIFGMGILSLLLIGGAVTGILIAVFMQFPAMFESLRVEIAEIITEGELPAFFATPNGIIVLVSLIIGIVFWSMIHSVFIRPFILTGVLRNFILSGEKDLPKEADFATLAEKSPKFAKLQQKALEK